MYYFYLNFVIYLYYISHFLPFFFFPLAAAAFFFFLAAFLALHFFNEYRMSTQASSIIWFLWSMIGYKLPFIFSSLKYWMVLLRLR